MTEHTSTKLANREIPCMRQGCTEPAAVLIVTADKERALCLSDFDEALTEVMAEL